MKVRIVQRFRMKGGAIKYPGEVIRVSNRQADLLIDRKIAVPHEEEQVAEAQEETKEDEEPEQRAWVRKPCPGCPKRRR